VHLLDSLNIIAGFSPFVKPKSKKFSVKARYSSQITVDFCEYCAIISVNIANIISHFIKEDINIYG
jgi:hypothetical protein